MPYTGVTRRRVTVGEADQKTLWVYKLEKLPDDYWNSYTQPFERTCHLSKSKLYKSFINASRVFVPQLFTGQTREANEAGGRRL